MNYQFDLAPVIAGWSDLLRGCGGTLLLAIAGMALATVIGIGGVALRDSRFAAAQWAVKAFVEVIRNTPFLVQIYFIFFALPFAGIRLDPTPTAIIALGVNGAPMRSRSSAAACRRYQEVRSRQALRLGSTRFRSSDSSSLVNHSGRI